jgi:hypothetical protein
MLETRRRLLSACVDAAVLLHYQNHVNRVITSAMAERPSYFGPG